MSLFESDPELEIVSTRVLNADPEDVFAAWSDADRLGRWWGPNGFQCTFETFDLRPGGDWRFVMHGPDGTDHRNHWRFEEIVPHERIVMEHVTGPRFRLTATFSDEGYRTRITWRMRFESAALCAAVRRYAVDANEQNFDRLEAELARVE